MHAATVKRVLPTPNDGRRKGKRGKLRHGSPAEPLIFSSDAASREQLLSSRLSLLNSIILRHAVYLALEQRGKRDAKKEPATLPQRTRVESSSRQTHSRFRLTISSHPLLLHSSARKQGREVRCRSWQCAPARKHNNRMQMRQMIMFFSCARRRCWEGMQGWQERRRDEVARGRERAELGSKSRLKEGERRLSTRTSRGGGGVVSVQRRLPVDPCFLSDSPLAPSWSTVWVSLLPLLPCLTPPSLPPVHSEANRIRIESVEKCFGASGIVSLALTFQAPHVMSCFSCAEAADP